MFEDQKIEYQNRNKMLQIRIKWVELEHSKMIKILKKKKPFEA